MTDTSNLKLYSLGIVTENKAEGSDMIKVSPMEDIRSSNDTIKEDSVTKKVEIPDAAGVKRSSSSIGGGVLVAKWIPFGHSNRITPPDVQINETVILFKFADADEYYWTTIFREPTLRRLETVNYGYSNVPGGNAAFTKETSYWLEVSTKHKYVKLHTSKNDGEPFSYDIEINTGKGTLSIKDNINNNIILDSNKSELSIQTNTTINITAPTINLTGNVNIKGNVTTIGNTTTTGNNQLSGDNTHTGNFNVTGNITSGGNVTANGEVHGTNI